MRNAHTPDSESPERETWDSFENDLVVTPGPTRLNPLLLPPLLVILAAVGVLVYRVRTPDWHWDSAPIPKAVTTTPRTEKSPVAAKPVPKAEQVAKVEAPKPAPTPASPEPPQPETAPRVAQTEDEIAKEAARIRAEREELEKIKKAEGERLAKIPPKPSINEQMHAQAMAEMMREMERMQQSMFLMMNGRIRRPEFGPLPPLGRGGFAGPGLPPEIERQIREMERHQEEFFRQAEARMRAHRGVVGPNRWQKIPAPPHPSPPPDIQRFRFSTPDGRIQELRMRLEVGGDDVLAL